MWKNTLGIIAYERQRHNYGRRENWDRGVGKTYVSTFSPPFC